MNRYILLGMRGVGKSTVAHMISTIQPMYTCYDTDDIFEVTHQVSIKSYINTHGIELFRKHEYTILSNLQEADNAVISTGGGIITNEKSRELLRQEQERNTLIIFLHAPLDTLYKRRKEQQDDALRPRLYNTINTYDEIAISWAKRKKWYYMFAHHIIYTEKKTPYDIAQEIIALS